MGRKSTFDKNEAIRLLESGFRQKDIARKLDIKESTLKMFFKRNASNELDKIREERKSKSNDESEFELKSTNLLSIEDLKEIREARTYGISDNETIGDYGFFMMNRQSYKYNKKTKKFVFDETRGKRTYAVPSSY